MMQKGFRNFTAAWLLIAFTISATPRLFLHDIFSCHADHLFTKKTGGGQQEFNTYRYNCGFINAETTVPYLPAVSTCLTGVAPFYTSYSPAYLPVFYAAPLALIPVRGPPCA